MSIEIPNELLEMPSVDERWAVSPFKNIKLMPAKIKGSRMEKITEAVLGQAGFSTSSRMNTDHDLVVDGSKVELKGSTVTKGTDDHFSFLQIRPEDDYDYLYLTLFYFDRLEIHALTKEKVREYIETNVFKRQHGGSKQTSITYCYNGPVSKLETNKLVEVEV